MASKSTSGTIVWNYENVEQLVELYEQRPCLYDTKSKDYFNRDVRNVALQDITKILNTTDVQVKTKLKNLRTQYMREKLKTKKPTGTGTDDLYVSKWPFYTRLRFLDDSVEAKPGTSNLDVS